MLFPPSPLPCPPVALYPVPRPPKTAEAQSPQRSSLPLPANFHPPRHTSTLPGFPHQARATTKAPNLIPELCVPSRLCGSLKPQDSTPPPEKPPRRKVRRAPASHPRRTSIRPAKFQTLPASPINPTPRHHQGPELDTGTLRLLSLAGSRGILSMPLELYANTWVSSLC